jgi:hypothetical protein
VLDEVDARIQDVRAFEPSGGAGAGQAAATAVCTAAGALSEFDRSIELGPSGPWSKRIAAQRRNLARGVESRLKQADGMLAKALPVVISRTPGRLRGGPRLDVPMEPLAMARAEALLAFAEGVRPAAEYGGFATVRAAVIEKLDQRLAVYTDDLVAAAHGGEPAEAAEARARLPFLADCLGRVRDAKAAAVVRRRAAAA